MTRCLDLFKSSLISALDRNYFLDRWISDNSMVTIIKNNYNLEFINKSYINKYIQITYLQEYHRFDYFIHKLKNEENIIINKTSFYYFSKKSESPRYFSTKKEWQHVYNTFRVLRCSNQQLTTTNTKRKRISIRTDNITLNYYSDDSSEVPNIITPPNFRSKLTICDVIGDYYTSSEGKILFNCPTDETVYYCLSRRIDHFELILNNKVSLSSIINRAKEKDCELNSHQTILMLHRMQYLKFSYLFMLEKTSNGKNSTYNSCCKRAIEHMRKNCGINIITNERILMKWNRTYRISEIFPHPNTNIQHGYTNQSEFLESFPEVKIMMHKWANENLERLNCEN